MSEIEYYPFNNEADHDAYIQKKGLDKHACSKHGLSFEFSCTECHDQWQKWCAKKNVTIVSEHDSTPEFKHNQRTRGSKVQRG